MKVFKVLSKQRIFLAVACIAGVLSTTSGVVESIKSLYQDAKHTLIKAGIIDLHDHPILLKVVRSGSRGSTNPTENLSQKGSHVLDITIGNIKENLIFDELYVMHSSSGMQSGWERELLSPLVGYEFPFKKDGTLRYDLIPEIAIGIEAKGPLKITITLHPMGSFDHSGAIFVKLGYLRSSGKREYLPIYLDTQLSEDILKKGYVYFPKFPPPGFYDGIEYDPGLDSKDKLDLVRLYRSELSSISSKTEFVIESELQLNLTESLSFKDCDPSTKPISLKKHLTEYPYGNEDLYAPPLLTCYISVLNRNLNRVKFIDKYKINKNGKLTGELIGSLTVGEFYKLKLEQHKTFRRDDLSMYFSLGPIYYNVP